MNVKYLLLFLVALYCCSFANELTKLPNSIYVVLANKLNVRSEPDENSKVISQVKISKEIKLLKRSDKAVVVDNIKGEWVLIDTREFVKGKEGRETVKGWVLDYYLSDLSEFKKINTFKKLSIKEWIGDWLLSYKFRDDGSYEREIYDYQKDTIRKVSGVLYQYRNVFVAKDTKDNSFEMFYISENGQFCHQHGVCVNFKP